MTLIRCQWAKSNNPAYQNYHDQEWGKLNLDQQYLFEMLVLETFQAGLSWSTIINKRKDFKEAFANFDFYEIAKFDQADITRLMNNPKIVRNKLKITATINNAQKFIDITNTYGDFATFLKKIISKPIINHPKNEAEIATQDENSSKLSQALKQAGFKFVGPVIIYSFLQAIGLINDHIETCSFKYK